MIAQADPFEPLQTGVNVHVSTPGIVDHHHCMEYQGNCSTHSSRSGKDNVDDNDCAETFSLGSWKDEADGLSEHVVEESSTNDFIQSTNLMSTPVNKSWADVAHSSQVKKSWADVAQEDELEEDEEDEQISKSVSPNDITGY